MSSTVYIYKTKINLGVRFVNLTKFTGEYSNKIPYDAYNPTS